MEKRIKIIEVLIIVFLLVSLITQFFAIKLLSNAQRNNNEVKGEMVEYNDGGAAGKFSDDVPLEVQIEQSRIDSENSSQYE